MLESKLAFVGGLIVTGIFLSIGFSIGNDIYNGITGKKTATKLILDGDETGSIISQTPTPENKVSAR